MLLSYGLWRDRFGSSPGIVGKTIRASGVERTVIGVMPDVFAFPIREALWIAAVSRSTREAARTGSQHPGDCPPEAGRLASRRRGRRRGRSRRSSRAEFPATNRGIGADVMPYARTVLGPEVYGLLYTMLGAGIGVLLIACVNVSNLLVARASLRRREVAVRMALGAGRNRVVRQHLTEVLVLATAGGLIGVVLSVFGMRWFTQALSVNPPPFWITFDLDYRVMLFVTALIVLTSLFAGALPALHAVRVSAGAVLKDDSRSSTSASLGRFSSALVVGELALSCGLLIAAGLMIKSVVQLKNVKMPFGIENVLTARVDLPQNAYPDSAASIRFFEQLLPRLRALPNVEGATLSDGLPAAGNGSIPVQIEGKSYPRTNDYPLAREGIVTAGYFDTFRARVLSGREFETTDTAGSQPVAIVNESFARTHFPGIDPIGHQIKRIRPAGQEPWLTVVGVVPDLIMEGIGNNNASPIGYYIPIAQSDVANGVRIAVRTRSDPAAMTSFVRSAVASLDPDLAIYEIQTMATRDRTADVLLHRVRHVLHGVRLLRAVPGRGRAVRSDVVCRDAADARDGRADGAWRTGAPADPADHAQERRCSCRSGCCWDWRWRCSRPGALQPVLYHVNPRDTVVFAAVLVTLATASLVASFLPARRVTRIDPVIALANE